MSNAGIDQNNRPTIIATLESDGKTIVPVQANASNHCLRVDDNTTGADNGNNDGNANLDENSHPVWTAESSDGSGNIIEVYATVDGKLLVDSA